MTPSADGHDDFLLSFLVGTLYLWRGARSKPELDRTGELGNNSPTRITRLLQRLLIIAFYYRIRHLRTRFSIARETLQRINKGEPEALPHPNLQQRFAPRKLQAALASEQLSPFLHLIGFNHCLEKPGSKSLLQDRNIGHHAVTAYVSRENILWKVSHVLH